MSSGERKRKSPNRDACIPGFGLQELPASVGEWFWESHPEGVKGPYPKREQGQQDPEYHETRGTLWERAGTTP